MVAVHPYRPYSGYSGKCVNGPRGRGYTIQSLRACLHPSPVSQTRKLEGIRSRTLAGVVEQAVRLLQPAGMLLEQGFFDDLLVAWF